MNSGLYDYKAHVFSTDYYAGCSGHRKVVYWCVGRGHTLHLNVFLPNYQALFLDVRGKKNTQSLQTEIMGIVVGRIMVAPKMSLKPMKILPSMAQEN